MTQTKKTEITRSQIITAALEEFGEKGFQYASIRRICKNGNFSNGKLFHHFEDKSDLYIGCIEYAYSLLADHIIKFNFDESLSLEENSLELFTHWQNFWKIHPELVSVFFESRIAAPEELRDRIIHIRQKTFMGALKTKLRSMFAFYHPDSPQKQAFLVGVWVSVLDYVAIGIGYQKAFIYNDPDAYLQSQNAMFKKVLIAFLYGMDSDKFREVFPY